MNFLFGKSGGGPCNCGFSDFAAACGYYPIQSGEVTFSGTSQPVTIAAVTINKSVLEFSHKAEEPTGIPRRSLVRGTFDSTTQIRFHKESATNQVTIRWFIWESRSFIPMTVQHEQVQLGASTALPLNRTITAVNTDKSFVIGSMSGDTGALNGNDVAWTKITGANNLQLDMNHGDPNDIIYNAQVIEHLSWDVKQYDKVITAADDFQTITSSPANRTYIGCSGKFTDVLNGRDVPTMYQESDTKIRWQRSNTVGTWTLSLYVVDTKGDFSVQDLNYLQIGAGQTGDGQTITGVNLANSFLKLGDVSSNSMQNFQNDDSPDKMMLIFFFTAFNDTRVERWSVSTNNATKWSGKVFEYCK